MDQYKNEYQGRGGTDKTKDSEKAWPSAPSLRFNSEVSEVTSVTDDDIFFYYGSSPFYGDDYDYSTGELEENVMYSAGSFVGGGFENGAFGPSSIIGAGFGNTAFGENSATVAGSYNEADAPNAGNLYDPRAFDLSKCQTPCTFPCLR